MKHSAGPGWWNVAELTYLQIGLTRELLRDGAESAAAWPVGYRRVFERIEVGHGVESFDRLSTGILDWEIQAGAGLRPRSAGSAVLGARVVCGFGMGPVRLPVPCEVVWSEQGERFSGFGYGTLPGHPASGEEAFVAELDDVGRVWFSVLAFSRPRPGIYTLGAPVSRLMQGLVTRRYLAAAAALAA